MLVKFQILILNYDNEKPSAFSLLSPQMLNKPVFFTRYTSIATEDFVEDLPFYVPDDMRFIAHY